MHVRVCRECGEEYRPEIEVCAECGGALEDRFEDGATAVDQEQQPAPAALPAAADRRSIFTATEAADVEPLARRLGSAGIPFAVRGAVHSFDLMVEPADAERALEAVKDLLPGEGAETASAFDPERGYVRCPACGVDLVAGAVACPECGLAVGAGAAGDVCPRCHAPLEPGTTCASCGFFEG